jgi:acyl-CoA synthetase (NDP forming)/GNAT superfamily N-acetyltransferase
MVLATEKRPYGPVDALLADGRVATIRSPQVADLASLVALHEGIGDESLRRRFFSLNRRLATSYAAHLADGGALALVATIGDRIVGVASCELVAQTVGEVAFLVADDAHGVGLGTLLLEHLAARGRSAGIARFTAEVLAENSDMLRVLQDCGFTQHRSTSAGVTTLELSTAATTRAIAAADDREARAEASSLRPLLAPRSVAVVGVRRAGGGVGRAVLDQIRAGGFAGDLYVVHPTATLVDGVTAYPDFASIRRPVDLVVVAVPAERVLCVVRDAAEAGAHAAVVLASGLGEAGEVGREQQRRLVRLARQHSMRVVGPNCLGVMNPGLGLNASFASGLPTPGSVAVASQSGGVGIALLTRAEQAGLGIRSFVSLGNKADVSGNDLLAAWYDDDEVGVAALYLESFGNPLKFARLARRFSERKPLLAITGGRSDSGRRAGMSHTASAAAPSVGIDALFAHAGVIGCADIDMLVDVARLLVAEPLPEGPRLAVLGNAGGLGILAADAAERAGVVVSPLPDEVAQALRGFAGGAPVDNPVDLGASVSPEGLLAAGERLLDCPEVDALLLIVVGTAASDLGSALSGLSAARQAHPAKPVLVVALGVDLPDELVGFGSVDAAVAALGQVARYAAWRAARAAADGDGADDVDQAADEQRERALAAEVFDGFDGWLRQPDAERLLSVYGIESVRGRVVAGAAAAQAAAVELGFPVVVKVADPDVVHKTDRGLVRVGLSGPDDVHAAVVAMEEELGSSRPEVVVQETASGVELAVGVVRDPGFGPLVMVAAGGVAVDVWADRSFLVPPITHQDADAAVRSLRLWPLLDGFRGAPAVDVGALVDLVSAVGRIAQELPQVTELDLNPVLVSAAGAVCVDAKIRVSNDAIADDAGVPRRLRNPA